ncbi:hypothetical protein [Bryobacter aggregatus]|uniref:hypothetical protein n=1 Tax=Bryobacter aggregatus TaxID=360054 RepID=UPI0004E212D6|nr:hypothetical protein [Bryobacter aggregatus]
MTLSVPDTAFRIVEKDGASLLLPPPAATSFHTQELSISLPKQKLSPSRTAACQVSNDLFQLQILDDRALLRMSPVDSWWKQADASLDEVLPSLETLEHRRCLSTHSALQLQQIIRESLPMRPGQSLYGAYGYRMGGGGLDLRSGMRVSLQRAHFRIPAALRKSPADGFIGISTVQYERGEDGDFRRLGVEYSSDLLRQSLRRGWQDLYFAREAGARPVYRLFLLTHYVRAGIQRSAIVIGASSVAQLSDVEKQLKQDPGAPCSSLARAKVACVLFEGEVTASVELLARIDGTPTYVPWGTTVRTVLQQRKKELPTMQLRRLWAKQLLSVEVDGDRNSLLDLALVAGDELSWE